MDRDIKFEKSVAEKIKELRKALGWSQQYLADIAGVDKKQVQRAEALGEKSVFLRSLIQIAKALGKQPYEVLMTSHRVKVNTDLSPQPKYQYGATSHVHKLIEVGFLTSPKSVKQIVQECSYRYNISLKSSAVSAIVKGLVERKLLKAIPAKIKGRFLYQKIKK